MGDFFMKLPDGFRQKFMQQVVSRTSPEDAIRLSSVSKLFQSVADSDVVWDSFIPPEHLCAIDPEIHIYNSSHHLFLLLALLPVYFHQGDDDNYVSAYPIPDCDKGPYMLDQWTGKRWAKTSPLNLSITYLHSDYWNTDWTPTVRHVVWLEIKDKISTFKLSPNTTYTAYLLFCLRNEFYYGFHVPLETSVGIAGEESINQFVYLDPAIAKAECQYIKHRDDNYFEVELGDYFHNDGETRDLEMTLREVKSGKPKCGIGFFMMELRPKRRSINLTHLQVERNTERREVEMPKEGEEGCEDNLFRKLPEGFAQAFLEEVVSRTSPVDACRLSVISKSFQSAAESDVVWEKLLPSDYRNFLCRADDLPDISFASKKDLYLFLIGNPLLIDANTKSFWLDKWSGKKCFMITTSSTQHPDAAHNEEYGDTYGHWRVNANGLSRFVWTPKTDQLIWFEVHGRMSTSMLSSDTTYTVLLVHKREFYDGYNYPVEDPIPFEASVGSREEESLKRVVYLDRKTGETGSQYAVERKDGWLEVELGEYFNKGGENKDLETSVKEVTSGIPKWGYMIQGIEIRPKRG
ncbi:uncharacterized protein LOC141692772 [Apium graveolens]|uniref:uncharacterized protein LOC141692772 n=1 Tax=Apium graveolens TaxID=4045 RepID=UPI003D7B16E5